MQPDERQRARELEARLLSLWTDRRSSPYPAQIALSEAEASEAACFARRTIRRSLRHAEHLFENAPLLGVWASLQGLANAYGARDVEVYRHIGDFLDLDLSFQPERERFKRSYRRACQAVGIAASGNEPTSLFFPCLGVSDTYLPRLAELFVARALGSGPPALEDTAAIRAWQRAATLNSFETLKRTEIALAADGAAWYAHLFMDWRIGRPPVNERGRRFHEALDASLARHSAGRTLTREDIVGPPTLVWIDGSLVLLAERSRSAQFVEAGAFPDRLEPERPFRVPSPWPRRLAWRFRNQRVEIPVAPDQHEILAFDAASGRLTSRCEVRDGSEIDLSARKLVFLATDAFSIDGKEAWPLGPDGPFLLEADIGAADEHVLAIGARQITLRRRRETGLAMEALVIGRSGVGPLYSGEGSLEIRLARPGERRIVRMSGPGEVHYAVIEADHDGCARLELSSLKLDLPGDPARRVFEVLLPGAREGAEFRAELRLAAFVWPGAIAGSHDHRLACRRPGNLVAERSAGIALGGGVSLDPAASTEYPSIAFTIDDAIRVFEVPFRGTRVWRNAIEHDERLLVPLGSLLTLGAAERHDTLTVRSDATGADLLVLGEVLPKPFRERRRVELGAGMLETVGDDDRVALRHEDGRLELLCRLCRIEDPLSLELDEEAGSGGDRLILRFELPAPIEIVRTRVESACGADLTGAWSLGRHPADEPPLAGVETRVATFDPFTIEVAVEPGTMRLGPARLSILLRDDLDSPDRPLMDRHGLPVDLGLPGAMEGLALEATLSRLTGLLARPVTIALGEQMVRTLGAAYREAFATVAASRPPPRLAPAFMHETPEGLIAHNDILGPDLAPDLLERPARYGLNPGRLDGLNALARCQRAEAPAWLPDPRGETALEDWLDHLASGGEVPEALGREALETALLALGARLDRADLSVFLSEGPMSGAIARIIEADAPAAERLEAFVHDLAAGAHPRRGRIATTLSRFALASCRGESRAFLERIALRTGLAPEAVGSAMSLLLRAGVELAVYLLALWTHSTTTDDHGRSRPEPVS